MGRRARATATSIAQRGGPRLVPPPGDPDPLASGAAAGLPCAMRILQVLHRKPAVELNNTFYQSPTEAKIASWLAATPPDFRFVVKAQRGGAWRALGCRCRLPRYP